MKLFIIIEQYLLKNLQLILMQLKNSTEHYIKDTSTNKATSAKGV